MPSEPVDLTNCDREPIHVPGAIQPHGVLLAGRGDAFTVVHVSENALDHLHLTPGGGAEVMTESSGFAAYVNKEELGPDLLRRLWDERQSV